MKIYSFISVKLLRLATFASLFPSIYAATVVTETDGILVSEKLFFFIDIRKTTTLMPYVDRGVSS